MELLLQESSTGTRTIIHSIWDPSVAASSDEIMPGTTETVSMRSARARHYSSRLLLLLSDITPG